MAKRFSETKIWEDEWYQSLPTKWKIAWKYLCDKCDEAGIWKPNFKLADFQINEKVKWSEAERWLNNGKIRVVITEKAWILKDFVPFQYGDKIKTSEHPFHKKIRRLLEETTIKIPRKKVTEEFKIKIFERDDFICQWCSNKQIRENLILDHFVPLSKGGGNESENLLTCCIRCNKYKYDFLPKDFIERKHEFIKPTTKTQFLLDTLYDTLCNRVQEEEEVKEEVEVVVNKGVVRGKFIPPTLDEVQAYCLERGNRIDAKAFFSHYEASGWMRGKTPIKNWKACITTWEVRKNERTGTHNQNTGNDLERIERKNQLDSLGTEISNM